MRLAKDSDHPREANRDPLKVLVCKSLELIVFHYYKKACAALGLNDDLDDNVDHAGNPSCSGCPGTDRRSA